MTGNIPEKILKGIVQIEPSRLEEGFSVLCFIASAKMLHRRDSCLAHIAAVSIDPYDFYSQSRFFLFLSEALVLF